ncbi:MAG: flagellin lysine-N-methylase [Terracidiphilus sp.]
MRSSEPVVPEYADRFRCIGSACEDTCCQGWSVPVDRAAWEKYQGLPESSLRTLIDSSILLASEAPDGAKPVSFAVLRMDDANRCLLLTEDRLCRIHKEIGEGFLSHTCATYPRIAHSIGGVRESALALSCPEAARLVLFGAELETCPVPESSDPADAGPGPVQSPGDETLPQAWFWPIRASVLALIRNRAYPLWQRMCLLDLFCRRLDSIFDAIRKGKLKRSVPEFLGDFRQAVGAGTLQPAMEALPVDGAAQLDVVLRLAGMMLHRSNVTPRFVECVQAFTAGIGNSAGATLKSLQASFDAAHDRYFAPFFERHPQVLENYLINTVIRCQFPFGRDAMRTGEAPSEANCKAPSMTRECVMLTAQFVLIKGLLIGVAGRFREKFSAEHVVHTAQAASKHFEHHPEFLQLAYELLVESRMDGALGLAILTRNGVAATPAFFRAASPAAPAPPARAEPA